MDQQDDQLSTAAAATPDGEAVVVDSHGGASPSVTTWSTLDRLVNRLARGLRAAGIETGDRLVWCGPNALEIIVIGHAARRLGLVAVPLAYRFTTHEMAYVVQNSDASCVIADTEQAAVMDQIRTSCPSVRAWIAYSAAVDGPAVPTGWRSWSDTIGHDADGEPLPPPEGPLGASMIYTSGTTGKPKGAIRTRTDDELGAAMFESLGLVHDHGVHLTTGPLYHSGPLAFATLTQTLGHKLVIARRFDPRAWLRLVRDHRVTSTFTAPTQLKRIVTLPAEELAAADMGSMTTLIVNAAPVPYALKEEVITTFGDGFLYEVYGSTELGVNAILGPDDQLRKPGSCGRPFGTIELRVLDDAHAELPPGEAGELFVRSSVAIDGYHQTDEQLAADDGAGGGWHSVGDVAYLDEEGYLYICDRKRDMIITGGMNVYPAEVEAVLHAHPTVLDAAVIGLPNDEWGEQVHAVVQPRDRTDFEIAALEEFVASRLADFKRPRSYEVRDELPRTESGKLLKRVLRDEHRPVADSES